MNSYVHRMESYMNKVFLSHSSANKDYVSYIAEQLGRDHCVYDAMCFEAGMRNIDEIFREMDKSSIFVIFLSDEALDSGWVRKELSIAEERLNHDKYKLSQIFPLIIDPRIDHTDPRIPEFLKKGPSSYNLRVITSEVVAYRKIKAQQTKFLMDNDLIGKDGTDCFYGRDAEIANFKNKFETGKSISCVIASGLDGIGRKSYLLECLKESDIIEKYYFPPIISLKEMDSIEDLIVKLHEVGFGTYSIEKVTKLADINEKIDALVEQLKNIQSYKEQIVIYDNHCLVSRSGEIVYWFDRAIKKIRPEITVIIASHTNVTFLTQKNSPIFFQALSTLPKQEWMGLMRVYGKKLGLELNREDREFFSEIITGYPPQVRYCVESMNETSIEEVKSNPHIIVEAFSKKVSEILAAELPKDSKQQEVVYGLLSFASSYGIVPTELLMEVINKKVEYKDAFHTLKNITACRYLGASQEYIEVNPFISDYIQRNHFDLPADIKALLDEKTKSFNEKIEQNSVSDAEDFENIKYYLKANIIAGKPIPEKFMYATVYLSSIYDLYNRQQYKKVISIVEGLKENGSFARYDAPIQARFQGYYCRSLAREINEKFYEEVEFFNHQGTENFDAVEYNFLKGFMHRNNSEYGKALECYKRVLAKKPTHRSAMREIVIVYKGLEDYESAFEYAQENYLKEPENPYQIQPYFEMLVRKPTRDRNEIENTRISEMIDTISRMHEIRPSTTYYEMRGQHETYIQNNKTEAFSILSLGMKKFPESSYIAKVLFDCAEKWNDTAQMQIAIQKLKEMSEQNKSTKVAYNIRQVFYYAHQGKPKDFIFGKIDAIRGINDDAKERIKRKVVGIMG